MGGFAIELTISLLEQTIIVLLFGRLYEERYEYKWMKPLVIVSLSVIIQLCGLYMGNANLLIYATMTVLMASAVVFLYKAKPISVFLILFVLSLMIGLTDYVGMLMSALFGIGPEKLTASTIERLVVASSSRLLFFYFAGLIMDRIRFIADLDIRRMSQLFIIIIMNIIFLILAADIYFNNRAVFSNQLVFITTVMLGVIILTAITIRITESIVSYTKKEQDWTEKENEYRRQLYYLDNLQKLTQELRSQRHDFKHHLDCVSGLLDAARYDEAQVYINKLTISREEDLPVIHTNHPYLTALLNTKALSMFDQGIQLTTNVYIPSSTHIEPLDLSIILGNAIDNAIEANEKLEALNRWIVVESFVKESHLYIRVANASVQSVEISENGIPVTSKEDTENHGFGISNIKFVVEKYDGIMKVQQPENSFVLNIAFPLYN